VCVCVAGPATPPPPTHTHTQVNQLTGLIELINGELSKLDRKKLITLCTIDVHARDVVQRLIDERVESATCFQWQSQMRYMVAERSGLAQVNVSDAEIAYSWEYIGNCGSLCITPLTDRCYITLTQAQRLVLGGAPAGPAGGLFSNSRGGSSSSSRCDGESVDVVDLMYFVRMHVIAVLIPALATFGPYCRYGQDRDSQGSCPCCWCAVLCLQLQRPDGLQGNGTDLQGPCTDRRLGLL
jgi:Hydrolytic ATP binding site of dynein motor region